jgi:hypothetical protein
VDFDCSLRFQGQIQSGRKARERRQLYVHMVRSRLFPLTNIQSARAKAESEIRKRAKGRKQEVAQRMHQDTLFSQFAYFPPPPSGKNGNSKFLVRRDIKYNRMKNNR